MSKERVRQRKGGGVELTVFIGGGGFDGSLKKSQIHERERERVIENE